MKNYIATLYGIDIYELVKEINKYIRNIYHTEKIEENILYSIDGYDPSDGDIHASYYNFYDFLLELKEHYKNNSDMEG